MIWNSKFNNFIKNKVRKDIQWIRTITPILGGYCA